MSVPSARKPADSVSRPPPGTLVLVVDDDAETRSSLAGVLQDQGYSVDVAANGRAAFDQLRSGLRPSVIVADLMMPEMDGWELARELSLDPGLATIPLVVMTAGGTPMMATAPVASGYLGKPLDLGSLLLVLRRARCLAALPSEPGPG